MLPPKLTSWPSSLIEQLAVVESLVAQEPDGATTHHLGELLTTRPAGELAGVLDLLISFCRVELRDGRYHALRA